MRALAHTGVWAVRPARAGLGHRLLGRSRVWQFLRKHGVSLLAIGTALAITVAIRVPLFSLRNGDLDGFVMVWCRDIERLGFVRALAESTINYNPPYVYLLWLINQLPWSRIVLIKTIPVVADYLCAAALAAAVYRIHRHVVRAAIAGFALLMAPTVIFNGALWGQCDMLYALPLVAALAARLHGQRALTALLFGVALSMKLQALFLFPLLGVWVLRRELALRDLLLVPLTFVVSLVPAGIAGVPLTKLFMIYPNQIHFSAGLSYGAPNLYVWLPDVGGWLANFGVWFAGAVTLMLMLACLYSRERSSPVLMAKQAMVFSCLTPFLLPHMHDRYIFLGDVLSILYAFVLPRYAWVALLVIGASFSSYFSFLFGKEPIPITLAAAMLGAACAFLVFDLLRSLYPDAFAAPKTDPLRDYGAAGSR